METCEEGVAVEYSGCNENEKETEQWEREKNEDNAIPFTKKPVCKKCGYKLFGYEYDNEYDLLLLDCDQCKHKFYMETKDK